jgi:tetratricopeptide (TPR) repeat protein
VDPLYARAWSGLSSTWAVATFSGTVPFEDGSERAEAAARRAIALDSLEGSAWANLGILHAHRERSLAAGEPYFRRAIAAEPGNPEIYLVQAAALRHAHQWDALVDVIRVARRLDPLSAIYAASEANAEMCAGRPAEALPVFRAVVELDPGSRAGHLGVARALAGLGRWDEAIAQLRAMALARGDSAMAAMATTARGEAGYWSLKHREGRPLLEARQAAARSGWISPWLLGAAEIGAGAIEPGMARLEAEVAAGSRMAYKLPCNPEIDQIRSTPGYRRLVERAGHLSVEPGPR